MQYRLLGKTGIQVSEIGLGCEGFAGGTEENALAMFEAALDAGINCMDLYSSDPVLRSRIGQFLEGRREKFVIQGHLCSVWKDGQYKASRDIGEVRTAFEDLLQRLKTDYVDIGMIHYVDSPDTWREIADGDVMRYALEQKRAGRIRSIGLSSHNPAAALAAVESGLVDVLMFSVNPCYDLLPGTENCEDLWADESYAGELVNMNPERERLYETCQRLGVGITVMKAFGGGDLLTTDSPAGMALTASQCIHYALTRPAVATVFSGVRSLDDLRVTLEYESATPKQRDYAAALATFPRISWKGHCMYCGHCAPCPKNIDVASVTKFLNLCRAQGAVPETVREHYAALKSHAGDCIGCGQCETRCPFGVEIRSNMQEALHVFGL